MKSLLLLFPIVFNLIGFSNNKSLNINYKTENFVKLTYNPTTIKKETIIEDSSKLSSKYREIRRLDSMVVNTIKGLSYVKNRWEASILYSFKENETITTLRKFCDSSLIAITENFTDSVRYFFNEIDLSGNLLHRSKLNGEVFNIININNFISNGNGNIYYMLNFESEIVYQYDVSTKKHKIARNYYDHLNPNYYSSPKGRFKIYEVIDEKIKLNFDKLSTTYLTNSFTSPDNRYSITLNTYNLELKDNTLGVTYELIKTDFWPSNWYWCFGLGNWNSESDKFYFDNSGVVACIWEIDIKKNTLDKIVSEHDAIMPLVSNKTIFYIEKNQIKRTHFIEDGVVIIKNSELNEALKTEDKNAR